MAQQTIRFEQFFAAPPEMVFDWFAEHENVGTLFYCRAQRLRDASAGSERNGVGSARKVCHGMIRLEQTVSRFERPELIEYQGSPHWPIGAQQGRLRFTPVPGGTQLEYSIEYDCRLPFAAGLLTELLTQAWRRGVQRAIESISAAVAA